MFASMLAPNAHFDDMIEYRPEAKGSHARTQLLISLMSTSWGAGVSLRWLHPRGDLTVPITSRSLPPHDARAELRKTPTETCRALQPTQCVHSQKPAT